MGSDDALALVVRDCEQPPLTGDPAQLRCAPGLEIDARSRDEGWKSFGHQHFPGRSRVRDAIGDVNRDPTDVVTANLDLAGVQAYPQLKIDGLDAGPQFCRAPDRAGRAVERGKDAVARRLDHPSTERLDDTTRKFVMFV